MQKAVTDQSMRRRVMRIGLIVLLGAAIAVPGMAQESLPTPSPTPQPTPIAASDIPARSAAATDSARQAVAKSAPDARLQQIQEQFPVEQARIKDLRQSTSKRLTLQGPASMIKESEKSWQRVQGRLDRWLTDLATRSSSLDRDLADLEKQITLWQITHDGASATELPKALIQQISGAIKDLSDAEKGVRSARNSILDLQASIAREKTGVDEMLTKQQVEISKRTKGVFGIDSPPLWKAFGGAANRGDFKEQFTSIEQEHRRSLKSFVSEQRGPLSIWLLMWPALALMLFVMHRKAEVWVQQDKSLQTAVTLLGRPVSAALIVTALLYVILDSQAPAAWINVVSMLLVIPMLRVLPPLLPESLRLLPYFLALLYLLRRLVGLAPEGFAIYRLLLLALALTGIASCAWFMRLIRANSNDLSPIWKRAISTGGMVALALFGLGAVTNLIGSVDFSTLVLNGTSRSVFASVMMAFVGLTLRSMVRVGLLTSTARRIGIAPNHSDTARTTLFQMISFFGVLAWAIITLRGFLLFDPLLELFRRAIDWKLTVGNFSIDPGDFLVFGFVMWISFKIAEFVQFMLNVDLMPRVALPKGVPQTISRLTRYTIIGIGAVIASAAAGFDISKVTIIIGALGVGIGFGLQNIVNNFVSGLILLFERPIRVGDSLDIGTTGGTVETIGMRASIVTTWDGAEVIVPNANLISEKVTNWTLTHSRRRMIIPVGVAYGTDPEKVAQLIVAVAEDQQKGRREARAGLPLYGLWRQLARFRASRLDCKFRFHGSGQRSALCDRQDTR